VATLVLVDVYAADRGTNNDVEGWHRLLNSKAGHGKLNLYQLVNLLKQEATLEVKLISRGAAVRVQRSKSPLPQDERLHIWSLG